MLFLIQFTKCDVGSSLYCNRNIQIKYYPTEILYPTKILC